MSSDTTRPRLRLAHTTLAARDLDRLCAFYCEVLGFVVTNRGPVPGGTEIAFLTQDPNEHHQIAMVGGLEAPDSSFVLVDHLAFRIENLDELRAMHARLVEAEVDGLLPICHGNAWSLYFNDPEGNGLECFVDTPFHVAQPFAHGLALDQDDEALVARTRALVEGEPEFQPLGEWRTQLERKLAEC